MGSGKARIAAVHCTPRDSDQQRLGLALLDASPRVYLTGAGTCRLDARGWGRRGGERAFVERVRSVTRAAGFSDVRVGIAGSGVAADAAARLADGDGVIVPPGMDRRFLAPLPLAFLPISEEMREMLGALGFRRIGELARLPRSELEARFGPDGLRARRSARGEDERPLLPLALDEPPTASLELHGAVAELDPLLFVLRRLLARLGEELGEEGRCAARLEIVLETEDGARRVTTIAPARPTLREGLLFDLCRAALERELAAGRLPAAVRFLALRVIERASSEVRQGDFFARELRDPLAADATLSRLRARLGPDTVVTPAPRADHRPESRNGWESVASGSGRDRRLPGERSPEAPAPVLRLLPSPRRVRVGVAGGRPATVWEGAVRHRVVAAEGPERISGDWWRAPYRREYHRLLTEEGQILWVFREDGWWLHGWWD